MALTGFVSGLDEAALQSIAAELLRLLDGGTAAVVSEKPAADAEADGQARRGLEFPAAEAARRQQLSSELATELFSGLSRDMAEDGDEKAGFTVETAAEKTELREKPGMLDALARARAAFPAAEASTAVAGAADRASSAPRGAAGGDMDAISEFFRRDSRRYDTGFGE